MTNKKQKKEASTSIANIRAHKAVAWVKVVHGTPDIVAFLRPEFAYYDKDKFGTYELGYICGTVAKVNTGLKEVVEKDFYDD